MRASGGTNFGFALSVVACTNSMMAFLAGPSFHEGRGSLWACALPREQKRTECQGYMHAYAKTTAIWFHESLLIIYSVSRNLGRLRPNRGRHPPVYFGTGTWASPK